MELPRRAVERVRAAAERRVDDRAAGASVLGAEVVGDDLELFDRVRRHLHDLVREALVAGAVGVVVDAVEDEVVERAAHAVHVERRVARRADRRGPDAGRQQREVGVGAAVQRQVDDLLVRDDLAAIARLRFQHAARAGDFDRFPDATHLQREVDALTRADGDRHVGLGSGESLQLRLDGVFADADVEELIGAGVVRDGGHGDVGGLVGEGDVGAGHGAAGFIEHAAEHGRRVELRGDRRLPRCDGKGDGHSYREQNS